MVTEKSSGKAEHLFGIALMGLGSVALALSVGLLLFMALTWLRTAVWPDWSPLGLGYLPPVDKKYLGINKIMAWFYDQQLALLFLMAGIVGTVWGRILAPD